MFHGWVLHRDEQVPILRKKIGELRAELEESIVSDSEQRPEPVIGFLELKQEALSQLQARAGELQVSSMGSIASHPSMTRLRLLSFRLPVHSQEYEGILGQDVSEYEALDEVVSELALKLKLWRGVKDWAAVTAEWERTPLSEVTFNGYVVVDVARLER